MLNNFSTVEALRDGGTWQFANSIFRGPKESGVSLFNTASYWTDIVDQIRDKRNAGYETSLTDM